MPPATRPTAAEPVPDVDEVRRIAAIANPILRNLEITECYSRLSAAVAARTGAGANWCTYATWASRQAGRTIRGEDVLDHVGPRLERRAGMLRPATSLWRRLLRRGLFQPETRLARLTAELHTPFDAFELASEAVARGNKKVFEEIGLEFARYLAACPPDVPPDAPAVVAFLDGLRPGDPPDGQGYLRQAFARLQRQGHEPDPKRRAELLLLSNLEIGLHEQTRLQPEIREALDAPFVANEELGRRALARLFPRLARRRVLGGPAAAVAGVLAAGLQREATEVSRELVTHSFMTLSLPGRVLALGVHLDAPYPELLVELVDPDLGEILARFEPAPPEPDDCGARDWSDLRQRMHYIVHLFRSFHASEDLLRPPFTDAQVASIRRGAVPAGEL
ncbi:MAG TPA: hypothetical protein VK874_05220 [Gaiellaceae bacterium]|nr:hypothetical protein [Gaiellaceae bacterium]